MAKISTLPAGGIIQNLFEVVLHRYPPRKTSVVKYDNRIISLKEVALHDNSLDCWIIIYDRVYDVTNFLEEHPGGSDVLLEYAGCDASVAFRGSGHSKFALQSLQKYLVGELPMEERIFRKSDGYKLSDID